MKICSTNVVNVLRSDGSQAVGLGKPAWIAWPQPAADEPGVLQHWAVAELFSPCPVLPVPGQAPVAACHQLPEGGEHRRRHGAQAPPGREAASGGEAARRARHSLETQILRQRGTGVS